MQCWAAGTLLAIGETVAIELPAGQGSLMTQAVMTGKKTKVIHLHRRDPQEALTRLNRITGLHFARWPESLLGHVASENLPSDAEASNLRPASSPEASSG